jgi:hypothetical protein
MLPLQSSTQAEHNARSTGIQVRVDGINVDEKNVKSRYSYLIRKVKISFYLTEKNISDES